LLDLKALSRNGATVFCFPASLESGLPVETSDICVSKKQKQNIKTKQRAAPLLRQYQTSPYCHPFHCTYSRNVLIFSRCMGSSTLEMDNKSGGNVHNGVKPTERQLQIRSVLADA
jgi:hypothetical protein